MGISEAINVNLLISLSQANERQDWKECCSIIEQQIGRSLSEKARNSLTTKLKIYQAIAAGKI